MSMLINWKLFVIFALSFLLYYMLVTSWRSGTIATFDLSLIRETKHTNLTKNPADLYHNLGMEDVTKARTLVTVSDVGPNSFSVISYNILADCYIHPGMYPNGCQTSEERHPRLLAELEALAGDIIQLQEVEEHYLDETLGPAMLNLGYSWEYKIKTSGCEGLATFYKSDKFQLVEKEALIFTDMLNEAMEASGYNESIRSTPQVFLMLKLQHNSTGNFLTIGNIHTIWANLQELTISTLQLSLAMQRLVNVSGGKSHIISGDMNNKPGMAPYSFLENGKLTDDVKSYLSLEEKKNEAILRTMDDLFIHNSSSLASSYKTALGKEPDFTNYEASFGNSYADCLDYIWYNEDCLTVHSVLKTVTEEDIGDQEKRLPNCLFPSDHLSLKTVFSFK